MPPATDVLDRFLPIVAHWFRETYGEPTPPQRQGWPAIAAGTNTLIFAPTGSGKTLAAFLACLDHLWRVPRTTPRRPDSLHFSPESTQPGHFSEPGRPARRKSSRRLKRGVSP